MGKKIGSMYWDIEAKTDKLTSGLKDSKQDVKNFSGEFAGSMTEVMSKLAFTKEAFSTFQQVFKTALDWGEQGATVIQTRESFDLLLKTIGAAPDLLDQLTNTSKGTISEMGLMSSTATLLAGTTGDLAKNLANATPELLEIAKAAQKLNPSLGDTTFLYNSIATGIKRASPLILDNLGIVVKVGKANEDYAKQLGKTVEQLTAEEQQMALLNATLEAGGNLINQVGGNTDSATDSFARMDVAIDNAKDSLMTKFAPAMTNAADAVTQLITGHDKLADVLDEHTENVIYSSKSYEEYNEEMNRVISLLGRGAPLVKKLSEEEFNATRITKEWHDVETKLADQFLNGNIPSIDDMSDATVELKDATNNAEAAMRTYTEALLFKIASEGLSDEAALGLAYAMGLVDESTVLATEKTKLYKSWLDQKLITEGEYYELIKNVNKEIQNIPENKTFDLWVNIHGLEGIETLTSMGSGGSSDNGFEMQAGGGNVMGGQPTQWGEYGRPEMFITPSSGQVVNAQQIVEAMRSSGVNMAGGGVTIENLNVYTNSGVDAIQYSIERAKGYAL